MDGHEEDSIVLESGILLASLCCRCCCWIGPPAAGHGFLGRRGTHGVLSILGALAETHEHLQSFLGKSNELKTKFNEKSASSFVVVGLLPPSGWALCRIHQD